MCHFIDLNIYYTNRENLVHLRIIVETSSSELSINKRKFTRNLSYNLTYDLETEHGELYVRNEVKLENACHGWNITFRNFFF